MATALTCIERIVQSTNILNFDELQNHLHLRACSTAACTWPGLLFQVPRPRSGIFDPLFKVRQLSILVFWKWQTIETGVANIGQQSIVIFLFLPIHRVQVQTGALSVSATVKEKLSWNAKVIGEYSNNTRMLQTWAEFFTSLQGVHKRLWRVIYLWRT